MVALDKQRDIMIILLKQNTKAKDRFIKVYDVSVPAETNVLGVVRVEDPDLIGRLRCRMFELVNGHFYF